MPSPGLWLSLGFLGAARISLYFLLACKFCCRFGKRSGLIQDRIQPIFPPIPLHCSVSRTQANLPLKLEFLDAIRGIAILLVFVHHALTESFDGFKVGWAGWLRDIHFASPRFFYPCDLGAMGVSIFFAISGFCIHWSYERSKTWTLKEFFTRRFFRIYLPFLVSFIVLLLVSAPMRVGFRSRIQWVPVASHLLLIQNFTTGSNFVNPSYWSLALEAQLYLLYPILLFASCRLGWKNTLLVVAASELSIRSAVGTGIPVSRWLLESPLAFWFSWAVGASVAYAYSQQRIHPLARFPSLVWFGIGCCCWFFKALAPFMPTFFSIGGAAIIARSLAVPNKANGLKAHLAEALSVVGLCSYSLYLWHQPLLIIFAGLLRLHSPAFLNNGGGRFVICLGTLAVLIPFSRILFQMVEVPSIQLAKKLLAGQKNSRIAS